MALITLQEYYALSRKTPVLEDNAFLNLTIEGVSEHVENWCDKKFGGSVPVTNERITCSLDDRNTLVIQLSHTPLLSIGTFLWRAGSAEGDLPLDSADVDYPNSILRIYYDSPMVTGPAVVVANYTYGTTANVPANVKLGTSLLVQEAHEAADRARSGGQLGPLQAFRIGSYSETYYTNLYKLPESKTAGLGLGTMLSELAYAKLVRYRRPGILFV